MDNKKIRSLFQQISESDRQAFNRLFYAYFKQLVNYAAIYVDRITDSEDLVSDVFLQLWLKRETLIRVNTPVSYMYKAVKNHCLNHLRTKKKQIAFPDDLTTRSWLSAIEDQELGQMLIQKIKCLPIQRKEVFLLVKICGYTNAEVANALGLSKRTVENHLYRAVKELANEISDYLGYDPRQSANPSFKLLQLLF